jgi:hypothetical protein
VVALAALALTPAAASAGLQVTQPSLEPVSASDYAVVYRIYAYAQGTSDHTRSEGVVVADSATQGVSGDTLSFQHDYPKKTSHLSLPTKPQAMMILQRGATYNIRVARWIAGGGGCSTCDEEGAGGPTTIVVPSVEPKDRLKLADKLKFSGYADAAFSRALKLRLMTTLSFSDSAANALYREAWRTTLDGQQMRGFALDPVDKHFRRRVHVRHYATVKPDPALGAAGKPVAAVLNAQAGLSAEMEAVLTSINRAQGAFVKHKRGPEKAQMLSAARHAGKAAGKATALATALDQQFAALRAQEPAAMNSPFGDDQALAYSEQVRVAGGLPAADLAELKALHAPAAGISLFTQESRSTTSLDATTPAAVLGDPAATSDLRGAASLLRAFAKRVKHAPRAPAGG